jgi:hypothetical protein
VESVTFDAAEVVVVAGAASGTIKLWDLEEAKSTFARVLSVNRNKIMSIPVLVRCIGSPSVLIFDCDPLQF